MNSFKTTVTRHVKWIFYDHICPCLFRDGVAVYYSSFCGSGVNKNNFGTDPVDSGCHRDKTSDVANNREVCFCQGPMCNESSVIKIKIDLLLVALLFSILCVYL